MKLDDNKVKTMLEKLLHTLYDAHNTNSSQCISTNMRIKQSIGYVEAMLTLIDFEDVSSQKTKENLLEDERAIL